MIRKFVYQHRVRFGLYLSVLLLFTLLSASCCPPALLERGPNKTAKTSASPHFKNQKAQP